MFSCRAVLFVLLGLPLPLCHAAAAVAASDARTVRLASQNLDPTRHMPLDKVRAGMTGYGVTALPGEPAARFRVEIVNVLRDFAGPDRHVILATSSGAGLEKTGILAGMSGSPVYMPDENGDYRMIGAVAYGWSFNKEPLCGIQPIEQMLTARANCAAPLMCAAPMSGGVDAQGSRLLRRLASGWRGAAAGLDPLFDMTQTPQALQQTTMTHASAPGGQLIPLAVPLAIAGGSDSLISSLHDLLAPSGLMPVSTASAGARRDESTTAPRTLKPGDPVSVLLAWGDMDISAVGTVTEVIGDDVYAFGHSFNADGPVELPLAAAEVKGRVASMERPFKIASAGPILGTFLGDQHTAIYGRLGQVPPSIPVEVKVTRPEYTQTFHYNVAEHPMLTPLMAAATIQSSLMAQKKLPERNTIHYTVDVDYGDSGRYRSENMVSASAGMATMSTLVGDVAAPVAGLASGPQGPVYPKAIKAEITLTPQMNLARIQDAKLLTPTVGPGQLAQIGVRFQNATGRTFTRCYMMEIPAGAAPGTWRLTAGSWQQHLRQLSKEQPDLFNPQTLHDLLDLLNLIGGTRQDRLYLRLVPKTGTGLSVAGQGMPDLPGYWRDVLADSAGSAAKPGYVEATVKQAPLEFALTGMAEFELEVKNPSGSSMLIP